VSCGGGPPRCSPARAASRHLSPRLRAASAARRITTEESVSKSLAQISVSAFEVAPEHPGRRDAEAAQIAPHQTVAPDNAVSPDDARAIHRAEQAVAPDDAVAPAGFVAVEHRALAPRHERAPRTLIAPDHAFRPRG